MKKFSSLIETPLVPVLISILILIVVDNLLLQSLQSPLALLHWAATDLKDPSLEVQKNMSVLGPSFPTWIDSFIWIIITLVVWLWKRKWVYVPLIIYTAWITFWLVLAVLMVSANLWNPHSGGAEVLLSDAFFVWVSNIVIFAIWYWLLDHNNQKVLRTSKKKTVNFMFSQRIDNLPGWEEWIPGIVDYLFLSFNTSTAFGASDTVILTKKAKLLIILQSVISLVLFVVIAARAINIIH